jgi:hypothetical protein
VVIEVLTFEGCPHAAAAIELASRIAAETEGSPSVQVVQIEHGQAEALGFLGSPSIRVDGRDVEPGAGERRDYSFGCRLYTTVSGLRPLPPEAWVRDALGGTTR